MQPIPIIKPTQKLISFINANVDAIMRHYDTDREEAQELAVLEYVKNNNKLGDKNV